MLSRFNPKVIGSDRAVEGACIRHKHLPRQDWTEESQGASLSLIGQVRAANPHDMVPDLPTVQEDGRGGIDRTHQFVDASQDGRFNGNGGANGVTNGVTNGNGTPPCNNVTDLQPAYPTNKPISHPPPAENGAFHSPLQRLNANATFWPPLKAVPLASYYKLHRIPSVDHLTVMAEAQDRNDVQPIELPLNEPTHTEEPQDKSPTNGIHNKILEQVVRTPGRQPSPQPTHLTVPGPGHPRVLQEQGSGYVAPVFEGKEQQMDQGESP